MIQFQNTGVYCILNKINRDMYIGSSTNIGSRRDKHFSLLKHNKHGNSVMQEAVNELGIENFELWILEFTSEEDMFQREQYYIDLYQPTYNIYEDVTKRVVPVSVKRKMSETKKRKFEAGLIQPNGARPVVQLTLDDEFVSEFRSIIQAGLRTGTDRSCIKRVLHGQYQQNNGFKWMYKEDYIDLIKSRELLGTPEMGNQQPSLSEMVGRFND